MTDCPFELLCDVSVPFVGPQGAVRVFAPQKGASGP
ncbi:MAG: glycerate kinase [Bacteroidales bacterium]|nr:glycerate kinase [Bacteroidales bacterium]